MTAKRVAVRLEDLGEPALVERLSRLLPADPEWVRAGSGADGAAVLRIGGRELLLSCDTQAEGQHFRREWITPRVLGRRAASVSLSDIAAMGGEARAALASLHLPGDLPVQWFDGIVRGIGERLAAHGAQLVGGNLARSTRLLVVDMTVLGCAPKRGVVQRAGARPGDRLLATGWLGESAAGLALLRAGMGAPEMRQIAELIHACIVGKKDVKEDVNRFRSEFHEVRYSYDNFGERKAEPLKLMKSA